MFGVFQYFLSFLSFLSFCYVHALAGRDTVGAGFWGVCGDFGGRRYTFFVLVFTGGAVNGMKYGNKILAGKIMYMCMCRSPNTLASYPNAPRSACLRLQSWCGRNIYLEPTCTLGLGGNSTRLGTKEINHSQSSHNEANQRNTFRISLLSTYAKGLYIAAVNSQFRDF